MDVMMNLVRYPIALLLASVLAGCASPHSVPLYSLDNGVVELPERADGAAVLLAPVKLADYLQREDILQRRADGSLAPVGADARWAGPLGQGVDQLLLRQLAWRLDTQRMALGEASGFVPYVQVELAITRLDSGPQQPAVLEAQWKLLDKDGKQQASRLVRLQEEHQGSTADQVRAQSLLLQRLGEQLASAIEPVAAGPRAKPRTAAKPKADSGRSTEAAAPRIPALETIRTEMEVFRF